MPDRELIHSSADVVSTLLYALDSGFQVLLDVPQPKPQPRIVMRAEVQEISGGAFTLIRPEWVNGPFQTMTISEGHSCGMFFVQPRVNFSSISVYFSGERLDQGCRRLGAGVLSWHRDWLEVPAKVVRATPSNVEAWFKRIAEHTLSGVVVKSDGHRYHVCRGVLGDPSAAQCLPPFDFIPWSSDVLQSSKRKRITS